MGAVRGALPADAPELDGLRAYAVNLPHPDQPAEHPDDLGGVASAWVDQRTLDDGTALEALRAHLGGDVDLYLVDERVRTDYERDWPDGTVSPGARRISFVRRLPTITREEMAEHWGDVHAPLARVHHPAIWRYVQNVVEMPLTPDAPEVDGIAELHFRSLDDLNDRFYDSPEGQEIIAADVRNFLERGAGWRVVARETWVRS
jgi:uncharacterized protein (TIGR02118 family)